MSDFVPSYKNEAERLKIRKQKDRRDKIRNTIISFFVILVIIGTIILGYILANINYSKYEQFESKMNIYGFSKMYENQSSKTKEKVTKSEAIKMILSCYYNVPEIEGIALQTDKTYPNAIWVEYAIKQGIVTSDEINEKNADDKVKYKEVLVWLYNVKAKMMSTELDTEAKVNVKDINAYNADQRLAIYDLINSQIIQVNTKNINGNQNLYKGKFNELIVNFAEKYNTITVGDARININQDKIPTNYTEYPYTLASVDKSTYELGYLKTKEDGFILPVDLYKDNKQYYSQVKNYVESYFDYLVNIDYNNITVEQMKRRLKKYSLNEFDDNKLEKYVEYVKQNHIKLTGDVVVQMPCVYYDGENYRVRTKIELNVESSDTKDNLLYYDLEKGKITYNQDKYTLFADIVMSKSEDSQTLYIVERTIESMLSKTNSSIVSVGD